MFRDLRHACRVFSRSPGFAVVTIAVLALGIGASTAVFSVVHALLLSPLRYREARQLVQIQSVHREQGSGNLAPATFMDVAAQTRSFESFAAQTYYYVNLTRAGTPALITAVQATSDYFHLFGVAPLLGRVWGADEAKSGAAPVVVIAQTLWETQFGSRRDIIGQTILLDDRPHTVIGVMPASFKEPWGNTALWMPMPIEGEVLNNRASRYWSTFARLKPGVSLAQASAELASVAARLEQSHPDNYRGWSLQARDLNRQIVGDYREALLIIIGAVTCVMLVTCANVAGLCLVRAASRRKELSIRVALGASGGRLFSQLITESLLLSIVGGIFGIMIGSWGLDALLATVPDGWLPRGDEVTLNTPVLLAVLALSAGTGVLFGLAPAFTAARADAQEALKETHSAGSRSAQRLRSGLVVAEIALALVLLISAGLLGRNLHRILSRDTGIDAARVLSVTISPSERRYDSAGKRAQFFARALAEIAALPGVESAGLTQTSPYRWGNTLTLVPVTREGVASPGNLPQPFYDSVSADYFKTMGTPLRAGRFFDARDAVGGKPVVIISESTARRFFGTENPIGRELTNNPSGTTRFEIVGVVGDIPRTGLANETPLQVYRHSAQRTPAFATLMVRTAQAPASVAKAVQAALWRVDPDLPFSDIAPMDMVVSRTVTQPRLYLTLFALFAVIALTLSGIGLYGLLAYSVAQRTREFGIRTALGADTRNVLGLVLREGAMLTVLGLALGLVGAFAAARFIEQLLFSASARDPLIFVGVVLLLGVVAILACLLPARRAARVDPLIALRSE